MRDRDLWSGTVQRNAIGYDRLPIPNGAIRMCEQCINLDHRIRNYQQLAQALASKTILEGVAKSIAELEAQKLALHPKPEK